MKLSENMDLFFIFLSLTFVLCQTLPSQNVYTNHWAVRISGGREEADKLASKYGYINLGQIGSLEDHYHFHHSKVVRRSAFSTRGTHSFIHMDPKVDWVQQQVVKARVKRHTRNDLNFVHFNDPKWSGMWYIHCGDRSSRCRSEMNILAAWQRGYTGKNVVVTILDDGIERNHPDLAQNYDQLASYDVNGNDHDPTPRYDSSNENKHGTRCAGEVAAVANNSHCIVGIAYNARIGGIRMLDGDVTDVVEAKSLGIRPDYIDIYSASWGPDDDGKTVDGPGPLAKQAFEQGIKKGRKGLGSIFVWASGNGGREGDHCSCDGYTNSIYTISVSSTTENGNKPWYLEVCSSTLATTYSSGEFYDRKIVTTDLRQRCTDGHTGTSVSAPMVAGVIALALEANPLITWRDVQHLLVKTSRPAHLKANDWKTNAAGHKVSHLYGFGLVDAEAMVVEAKKWRSVPSQHTCTRISDRRTRYIRPDQYLNASISSSGCAEQADQSVVYLEHVVVRVLIVHPRRGDLQINLISPSGTRSQLLAKRLLDNSNEGFRNWEFMTVHCWGEKAEGQWTLEIFDSPSQHRNPEVLGKLKEWTLILHGTAVHPYHSHTSHHSRSRMLEIPSPSRDPKAHEPQQEITEEEEEEYDGPCRTECGDQGCDGPNADHCLNCVHFSLRSAKTGRTCVSQCPLGYYGDVEARRCRRCFRGCETCVGRASNQCLSCRRGLYLHADHSSCVNECATGYFADDVQRQCAKCHENCLKCVRDSDRCTACNDGYSLAGMTCVPECADGTFFNLEEMKCIICHHSCATCTGPGKEECIQCAKDFLQQEWKCVPACTEGYYPGEAAGLPQKMCRKCEENCLSCQGPGVTCSRCREGYNLVSRTCIANATCNNADEVFCEMVKSNRLCEKKLFRQFCCRTCLMTG
ncbi:proprotein convertase subtilisin/kexin type 6 isoform X1 [Anguilla anguilla]|uniref:proprotein convertase subtilisin/kexin type 6 isoform X1 n=2 Tax=Anguilla anguilla TaxID=7936 RepID=UPI0015ADEF48|nr:proprotein convertase subtilisin/kexin type 6 isoform X1 [Anguilla anguilla]